MLEGFISNWLTDFKCLMLCKRKNERISLAWQANIAKQKVKPVLTDIEDFGRIVVKRRKVRSANEWLN